MIRHPIKFYRYLKTKFVAFYIKWWWYFMGPIIEEYLSKLTRNVHKINVVRANLSSSVFKYRVTNRALTTGGSKIVSTDNASLRRMKMLIVIFKSSSSSFLSWIGNNKIYTLRLLLLITVWTMLYSAQYSEDSSFIRIICSSQNFIYHFFANLLHQAIYSESYIWYIPFAWILIWFLSLIIQWIFDVSYINFLLRNNVRNAGEMASINVSRAQIFEFGLFLLSFCILLLHVKNSTLDFNFSDSTPLETFHFNTYKPYIISVLCFILYGCFILFVSQVQSQKFSISKMPTIIAIFIVLFLNMIIVLHTSHLILIIMCLETFALSMLYFMISYYERVNKAELFKAILQFFMSQAIASLLYVYGMSLLANEFKSLTSASAHKFDNINLIDSLWSISGFSFLILGLIMKIGIGPMGFWIFTVIRQLNFGTIAIYFTFIKLIYLLTLVNILQLYLGIHFENGAFFTFDPKFKFIFIGFGVMSLIIGVVGLVSADNLKTFLAFSSFVNYGLILPAFYFGGSVNLSFGFALPYILLYSVTTLLLIFLLAKYSYLITDNLTELQGLIFKSKLTTIIILVLLSSLSGLPPFGGFFGKFYLLRELFYKMPDLGKTLIALSVLAAIGYARIIVSMFISTDSKVVENSTPILFVDDLGLFVMRVSYLFILISLLIISFFGIIFYYYGDFLCDISFGFSNQYLMNDLKTMLPQRDWLPIMEELSKTDKISKNSGMWDYINSISKTSEKLKTYLASFKK
jgi:NADH-quinone oxidoreductase subunit N